MKYRIFILLLLVASLLLAGSNYGRTDGQIKMQNDVIDWVGAYTSDATFSLNSEKITVDTLEVDSVFTFSGDVAVDSIYSSSNITAAGKTFQIWDTEFNADTNPIIIVTEGAELINEAAADTIAVAGGKRIIWSDGTNWFSGD